MKISTIIPVEFGTTEVKAIEKLKEVDYPLADLEVIITEGTKPSLQRNEAVKISKGDILYFLDGDSEVTPMLFRRVIELYKDESVAVVGGPNICPLNAPFLQHAFDGVQTSFFGSFLIRARYRKTGKLRETSEKELILCNMSMRKSVFVELGGFVENLYPNEENELLNRIKAKGLKLIYDPDAFVERRRRESIAEFIEQNFKYGRGRAKQMLINFFITDLVHITPAVFSLYIISLFFVNSSFYITLLYIYLIINIISSISAALRYKNVLFVVILPFLFFIRHFFYGVGFILGIIEGKRSFALIKSPNVRLKVIKEFGKEIE